MSLFCVAVAGRCGVFPLGARLSGVRGGSPGSSRGTTGSGRAKASTGSIAVLVRVVVAGVLGLRWGVISRNQF